jgi:hypothetical protein
MLVFYSGGMEVQGKRLEEIETNVETSPLFRMIRGKKHLGYDPIHRLYIYSLELDMKTVCNV